MKYNWQQKNWPEFQYDLSGMEDKLHLFSEKTGLVAGVLKALPEEMQIEAIVEIMVAEAIKTSAIEGEFLSRKDVMSSIKNDLGLNIKQEQIIDKHAKGIGELMISVRETYQQPLTKEQLFAWHTMLFAGAKNMNIGVWRNHQEPMQVVSGGSGKEKVHFEAPPSEVVAAEMDNFVKWFNETAPDEKKLIKTAPVRAAIAHLYFESIHPFEDGNGRIGRAIAEKALSQNMARPAFLSLSKTIEADKNAYYLALETAQKSLDITQWVIYFLGVILDAQQSAENLIDFALKKTRFFDQFKNQLNNRQLKVIKRMLEEGPQGFEGGINASKYGSLTHISKATATRDLQNLSEKGVIILLGESGGRSTRYQLNI